MIEVTRIQYPVGQGCFHAGSVKWKGKPKPGGFRYVYDCGSKNRTALTHSVNALLRRCREIDALFVSHLHEDHVSGLDRLLGSARVNTVFLPHLRRGATVADLVAEAAGGALSHSLVEASLEPQEWFRQRGVSRIVRVQPTSGEEPAPEEGEPRYADISWEPDGTRDADRLMKSGEMLAPGSGAGTLDWVLVPHVYVDQKKRAQLAKFKIKVAKVLDLPDLKDLTVRRLAEALRDLGQRGKLRSCYKSCFGGNHNRVSMSVYSGPRSDPGKRPWNPYYAFPFRHPFYWRGAAGWIGTGDAHLNVGRFREDWERSFQKFLPNLSTLLLPHHGSSLNFSPELLNCRKYPGLACCIASAGDHPSQYPHPGAEVVESVMLARRMFHHVSERPDTLFCERFRLEP